MQRRGTVGIGSMIHYNLEIIQSLTGAQFTHIPMKGGEAVITAVLGGHVEATCDGISKITPHAEAGKMRILLISKKSSQWPNVPTIAELGYKAELFSVMFSVFGPAGLPQEVTRTLVPAIEKAVKDPDVKTTLEKQGYVVDYKSPAELKKIMESDYETALYLSDKLGIGKKDKL